MKAAEITFYLHIYFHIRRRIPVSRISWRLVLEKRYLNFETWEGIAAEMYISSRTVLRMHEKALEAVQEILDREAPGHDPESSS